MGLLSHFRGLLKPKTKEEYRWQQPAYYINGKLQTDDDKPVDAMSLPAFFRGIDTISTSCADLDIDIFERSANGRIKATDHVWFDALRYQPNPYSSAYDFWRNAWAMRYQRGNCYIRIDRLNHQLHFLSPETTRPFIYEGRKYYGTVIEEQPLIHDYKDVIHLHTMATDWSSGQGVNLRDLFRLQLGLGVDIESYSSNLLNSGAMQRGYIKTDIQMKPNAEANMARAFKLLYDNGKKDQILLPILNNADFKPLNFTPQEMQLLERKRHVTVDVANILGIQLHLLNSLEKANYNSLEAQGRDFLGKTIQPLLSELKAEIQSKIFDSIERKRFYAEHNVKKLLWIDAKTQVEILDKQVKASIITTNEARAKQNMPAIEGGDELLVPVNMQSSGLYEEQQKLRNAKAELELAKLRAELTSILAGQQKEEQEQQAELVKQEAEQDCERIVDCFAAIQSRYEPMLDALYARQRGEDKSRGDQGGQDAKRLTSPALPIIKALAKDVTQLFESFKQDNNYNALAESYSIGLSLRFSKDQINSSYEINRAINAHARLIYQSLSVDELRWVGGDQDGIIRPIAQAFIDKSEAQSFAVYHPPIAFGEGDHDQYIVPANQEQKEDSAG